MSEASDQPVVEAPVAGVEAGVVAEAPATTTETEDDDIDTDAYDRQEVADDGEDEDPETPEGDKPGSKAKPAAADDDEEIELADGRKVKVPKEVAQDRLRQADYTRKTQELADQRRAVETAQAQQLESLNTFRNEHLTVAAKEAELSDIEKELAGYRQYSAAAWEATKAMDRAAYDAHRERLDHLQLMRTITTDALTAAKAELKTKETSLTETRTAAEQAKLREEWAKTNAVLSKDLPGWGEEKFKSIGAFVTKEFGIKPDQLPATTDPTAWKMANRLMQAEAKITALETAAKQTKKAADTAKVIEVETPAKPAGGSAKPRGPVDNTDTKTWMSRRTAQVERKQA